MIHEVFAPLAKSSDDMQAAKTCSEIFTGEYRFVQSEEDEQYGSGEDFFTNSDVQLLNVQVSYMEEAPSGDLWNALKFATFGPKQPPQERMIELYTDSVGKLQSRGNNRSIANIVASIGQFEGGWKTVNRWYGDEVAKKGRSLLSAYFLGRVAGKEDVLVETLVYPEHIRQSLRLLIRDMFIASLPEVPEHDSSSRATIRDKLLDNERLYTRVSDIFASNQLFNPEHFQRFLEDLSPYLYGPGAGEG